LALEAERGKVDSTVSGASEHQESGGSRQEEANHRESAEEDANCARQEGGGGRSEEALVCRAPSGRQRRRQASGAGWIPATVL
jgi:hypothetical protein